MIKYSLRRYLAVALPFVGSAILLFSCGAKTQTTEEVVQEALRTEYSENLSITMSENGLKSYHFETPLMEGYSMESDPYREFRRGIKITTFEDGPDSKVAATLEANYAIFYEDRKLWEAKGDVVAENSDGRQLFTSQLFWNQATHRIYSNVDSKIVDGDEVYHCEGFESDESMSEWTYRKLKGVTYLTDDQLNAASGGDSQEEEADVDDDAAKANSSAKRDDSSLSREAKPSRNTSRTDIRRESREVNKQRIILEPDL